MCSGLASVCYTQECTKVIKCSGADILLSTSSFTKDIYDKLSGLNDEFAVIVTHGDERNNPSNTIHEAKHKLIVIILKNSML